MGTGRYYIIRMLLWIPLLLLFQGDSGGPAVCKRDIQWVLVGVTSLGCSCGYRYYYYFRVKVVDLQYVNVTVSGYWSVLHHSDALLDTVIIIISG